MENLEDLEDWEQLCSDDTNNNENMNVIINNIKNKMSEEMEKKMEEQRLVEESDIELSRELFGTSNKLIISQDKELVQISNQTLKPKKNPVHKTQKTQKTQETTNNAMLLNNKKKSKKRNKNDDDFDYMVDDNDDDDENCDYMFDDCDNCANSYYDKYDRTC